jgi:hypothetical protein
VRGEQPVLWYELRAGWPDATFEKTSRSWRLRKDGGDSSASEENVEQETGSERRRIRRHSLLNGMRNCVCGLRSALKTKEARAQVLRVVLVSQR